MRRPNAAGTILQALDPVIQKLTCLEEQALRGEAMPVVEMASQLAATLAVVARQAIGLVLDQAARAQPTEIPCSCGGTAGSQGFEDTFFVGRYGRVALSRRRVSCAVCHRSWLPLDQAWGVPSGAYTDDVREATERLSCRLGFDEAVEELQHLWGVSPDGTTAKLWVGQDGRRAEDAAKTEASQHWQQYEAEAFARIGAGRSAGLRTKGGVRGGRGGRRHEPLLETGARTAPPRRRARKRTASGGTERCGPLERDQRKGDPPSGAQHPIPGHRIPDGADRALAAGPRPRGVHGNRLSERARL